MKRQSQMLSLLAVILMALLVLSGCGSVATTTTSSTPSTVPTTVTSSPTTAPTGTAATIRTDRFPVAIQNGAGQDVVIQSEPMAIVCTNVWAAEILFELVDTDRLVGLSMWNDEPTMTVTAEKAKSVKTRVSTQQAEGIISLMPYLVIIDSFSDPDGALTKILTDAGAVVLAMNSPTDFTMITDAIRTLAKAVGAIEQGEQIISEMNRTLDGVSEAVDRIKDEDRLKTLFYEAYYDQSGTNAGMLAAYGKGSTFDAIAEAAGLVNVCNAPNYSAVSKEKIVGEWQPDILIVPGIVYNEQYEPSLDLDKSLVEAVLRDPLMETLPAVQNRRVFALTEAYRGSTSQYMAKAVEELAKAAYPQLFP